MIIYYMYTAIRSWGFVDVMKVKKRMHRRLLVITTM